MSKSSGDSVSQISVKDSARSSAADHSSQWAAASTDVSRHLERRQPLLTSSLLQGPQGRPMTASATNPKMSVAKLYKKMETVREDVAAESSSSGAPEAVVAKPVAAAVAITSQQRV